MRKADERRRAPRHVSPSIRSRQLRDGQSQVDRFLADPKLDQFKADVARLVDAISKQPRLTRANRVELPDGTLAHGSSSFAAPGLILRDVRSRRRFEEIQPSVRAIIEGHTSDDEGFGGLLSVAAGDKRGGETEKALVCGEEEEERVLDQEMKDLAGKSRRREQLVEAVCSCGNCCEEGDMGSGAAEGSDCFD